MVASLKIALTSEEITLLKSYKRSRFSLVQHKAEALLLLNGNKRWYRGSAKAWVTIDGDDYYARAYSKLISEDCSPYDSIL